MAKDGDDNGKFNIIDKFSQTVLALKTSLIMKNFIASSVASSVAEIKTLPICSIKTNYQANLNQTIPFTIKNIYANHGIRGFYSATYPAITAQIISSASKYTVYNYLQHKRGSAENDLIGNMLNGACAGSIVSLTTHPFDLAKVLNQQNLLFKTEYEKFGLKLLYRGYSKTLTKSIILTSSLFPLNSYFKSKYDNIYLSSGLASFFVTFLVHPWDLLKVRHMSNLPLYIIIPETTTEGKQPTKSAHLINQIKQNINYYYRGMAINLFRVIPHFMLTMCIAEKIKERIM